jgi:predicted transcriptional regulator
MSGTIVNTTPKPTFTIAEVAALLGLSRPAVSAIFENEPGILILERPERMHKRAYRSIRIPRTVLERVLLRLSKDGQISVKYCKAKLG